MKPTLFSEKALTEKANKLYDQGKIYDAPSYKQGYEACKEDLRAWAKENIAREKRLKTPTKESVAYVGGGLSKLRELLAELDEAGR
jgi:hypothetical protein